MNAKIRRLLALVLALCMAAALFGCSDPQAEEPPVEPVEPVTTPVTPDLPSSEEPPADVTPEPSAPPDDFVPDGNVNPLTGLCDGLSDTALASRPVAVMVSNIISSLPQWGVADADILIEMLAEGRITRLMALYQDPAKIDHIASIRSARPYFIDMAQSFGAVYIHFGGSVPAYDAIKARKDLLHIDGISGNWEGTVFFRDKDRKAQLGSEHSVYTTGELLQKGLERLKADLTLAEQPSAFTFGSHPSAESGQQGEKVQITYSSGHKPYFEYDESTGEYLRYEYGAKQMDGWTKEQISVKNVVLLRMDTTSVPNSSLGLIEIQTTGAGEGYYFCGGKYIPITWSKDSYNGALTLYDASGAEVVLARGQTFISCTLRTAEIGIW